MCYRFPPGPNRAFHGWLYSAPVYPVACVHDTGGAHDFRMISFPLCRRLLLVALLSIGGCATTRGPNADTAAPAHEPDETRDPFEGFNRAMYTFNEKLDTYFLKPVAKGYRAVVPTPARQGVSNFFSNLREPMVMVNDALQGKFTYAASDLGRFLTNSTLGVLGVFDVASRMGLEKRNEDFGQTLAVWGFAEGPYLVLPFLGPSGVRDGVGWAGDYYASPVTYMEETSTAGKVTAMGVVDTRARYIEAGDILYEAAGDDPYIFVREAYRQRRRNMIHDGAAPTAVDPSIFEDDPPAKPGSDTGPGSAPKTP